MWVEPSAIRKLVEIAVFVDQGMLAETVFGESRRILHAYGQYIVVTGEFLR